MCSPLTQGAFPPSATDPGRPLTLARNTQYSLHINISRACMDLFKTRKLEEVAGVEQDMVQNEDANGNKVKNLLARITSILRDADVAQGDKLRLLMLYIISQEGIKDSDRRELMRIASVPTEKEVAIANMHFLGVKLTRSKSKAKKSKAKKSKARHDDVSFDLSRYQTVLRDVMDQACQGTLSVEDWPYVKEAPPPGEEAAAAASNKKLSVRKTAPKWSIRADKTAAAAADADDAEPVYNGGRIIVFVAGGVALSEVRSTYEVSRNNGREVLIGSTNLIEPDSFVADLASLKPPASLAL